MLNRALVLVVLISLPSGALAQAAKKANQSRPKPTVADYKYANDSPRQRFDFWQAKSDSPTPVVLLIHGGGWVGGDKSGYGERPIKPFLTPDISVAAIDYRYTPKCVDDPVAPPVKGCLMDAARALQTIRSKSKEWNIDPKRVGSTGGS